ncbi:hypothetical protein KAJ27_09555 [bacterium]|nr:hypothetical protein [bacterium]
MSNNKISEKIEIKCPECSKKFKYEISKPDSNNGASGILSILSIFLAFALIGTLAYYNNVKKVSVKKISTIADVVQSKKNIFMHITGKVSGQPIYDMKTKVFTFILDDGTGNIEVRCPDKIIRELIKMGNIPIVGFSVGIRGDIVNEEKNLYMKLEKIDNLFIRERPVITLNSVGDVMRKNMNFGIKIAVRIDSILSGNHITEYLVRELKSNKLLKVIVPGYLNLDKDFDKIKAGDKLEVVGLLTEYKNEICILPFNPMSFKPVPKKIKQIEVVEEKIIIVQKTKDFGTKGIMFVTTEKDTGIKINAILWKTNGKKPDYVPGPGDVLKCKGIMKMYKTNSEFIISSMNVIQVNYKSVIQTSISEIGNYIGRFVRISGIVKNKKDQKNKFELFISDDTGNQEISTVIELADFLRIRNNGLLRKGTKIDFVAKVLTKKSVELYNPESTVVKK